jgi:hypothetical protein
MTNSCARLARTQGGLQMLIESGMAPAWVLDLLSMVPGGSADFS